MLRRRSWMLAGLIALPPAAAHAQSLKVAIEEEVVATLAPNGDATVTARNPAHTNAFEAASVAHFASGAMDDAIGPNGKPMGDFADVPSPVAAPDMLRLRFTSGRVRGKPYALLVIENGYDRALVYRATMWVGEDAHPTDVCLVMPRKLGVEHWPHPIKAIELREMRLVAWEPGDAIPCE